MSSKKILRAVSLISLGTIIARVFGLAREVSTANFFGTTYIYDAFLIAFMIPNFFRGLLGEGALNAAFIPVFTEYAAGGPARKKEGTEIFNICFTLSLFATIALFIAALGASFLSSSLLSENSKWWWTWTLLRFTFPYLVFISLTALNMGVLNAHKIFLLPSLSPVILDVVWIAALFLFIPFFGGAVQDRIFVLCAAVVIGGAGQFLFTLIPVLKRGYRIRFNCNFTHPVVKLMGKLLAPAVIGVAVAPINILVDMTLANLLYEGAVSGLWYSTRIFQLPLGVFAIAVSTAVLPWFSEDAFSQNHAGFIKNLDFSFRMLAILLIPFTFGLVIFRTEIVSFLFERGMFGAASVPLAASPLAFYAIGLLGYGGVSVLTRAFYARRDTATPVKVGLISILVNFVADIALMRFMGHNGIALATSAVGISNFILLAVLFNRKHLRFDFRKAAPFFRKTFLSSAIMGLAAYAFKNQVSGLCSLPAVLFSGIITAALVYFLSLSALIGIKNIKG
ncbi:MAG: murein biosynthesis integral membrane protein MurJ [Candidatus Omnitrophica bacterium]|nr:murein biosynthesis integral membrane protein MurJ [Candidatus Omnitrophota bacterium]